MARQTKEKKPLLDLLEDKVRSLLKAGSEFEMPPDQMLKVLQIGVAIAKVQQGVEDDEDVEGLEALRNSLPTH